MSATGCDGWVAPSQADADSMADAGFNSVRLAFSWANLEPKPTPPAADGSLRHVYDQRYLAALDDAVHAFTSRGMAVTLDLHQVRWSPAFKDLPVFGHPGASARVAASPTGCTRTGAGWRRWSLPNGRSSAAATRRRAGDGGCLAVPGRPVRPDRSSSAPTS